MFRLFLERILIKKSISPDNKHLHHYLIKNFDLKKLYYLFTINNPIIVEYIDLIYSWPIYLLLFCHSLLFNYCKKNYLR